MYKKAECKVADLHSVFRKTKYLISGKAPSVFCRAYTQKAFKGFTEEVRVGITAHHTYLFYRKVGRGEKLLCGRHSKREYVSCGRHSNLLLEKKIEAGYAEMLYRGKIRNVDI